MGIACTRPLERVAAEGIVSGSLAPDRVVVTVEMADEKDAIAIPVTLHRRCKARNPHRGADRGVVYRTTRPGYKPLAPSHRRVANGRGFHRPDSARLDREGYSPKFFKQMWREHRIACLSYHKYPKGPWPEPWFQPTDVTLPSGEQVSLKLAELGSWVGDRQSGLFVREVRKLTESGHQTSLISTAYGHLALQDAAGLFSRWAQENFFRYMIQHYAIDLLSDYQTEEIPGTNRPVVNPPWRELERQSRSLKGRLTHRQARFAALTLHPQDDQRKLAQWQRRKAVLREEIEPWSRNSRSSAGRSNRRPSTSNGRSCPRSKSSSV